MRKTSLILLGAAAGAALTLLAVQPRVILVGASAKAPIGALGVEIVERDVGSLMRLGCRGDDAGWRALLQPVE